MKEVDMTNLKPNSQSTNMYNTDNQYLTPKITNISSFELSII